MALLDFPTPIPGLLRNRQETAINDEYSHVDVVKHLTEHRLREGLNALVRPAPVSVTAVEQVADDWHARFSCIGRRYVYRILNRRAPSALDKGKVWHGCDW